MTDPDAALRPCPDEGKPRSCSTCRFYPPPLKGKRRIATRGLPCSAPVPMPVLPESVTRNPSFRWPPSKNFMWPKDGEHCPIWNRRAGEGE